MTKALFTDRKQAGQRLAARLQQSSLQQAIVLGLLRGGVPVASEVAKVLGLDLDVFIVRKLSVPPDTELAIGAIASGSVVVMNEALIKRYGITQSTIDFQRRIQQQEMKRRESMYRTNRPALSLQHQNVILVDDGIATGATMLAAIKAVKKQQANTVTVATPVASSSALKRIENLADKVVCLAQPHPFMAVGNWYANFEQVSDHEVKRLLNENWQ